MSNAGTWYSNKMNTYPITWVMPNFTLARKSHAEVHSPKYILKTDFKVQMKSVIVGQTMTIQFIQYFSYDFPVQVRVAILDAQGRKCAPIKSNIENQSKLKMLIVEVDISCIDKNRKNYLFNDSLTILCEYHMFEKTEIEDQQLKSTTGFLARTFLVDGSLFFNNPVLSDTKIIVGEKTYYGHKSILAMRCPFFYAMFTNGMKEQVENEVTIRDVDPDVFEQLLYFIYTATVKDIALASSAHRMMMMANMYQMSDLVSICVAYLMTNITPENAIEVFEGASTLQKTDLAAVALKFLTNDASQIDTKQRKNQRFERLDVEDFVAACKKAFQGPPTPRTSGYNNYF